MLAQQPEAMQLRYLQTMTQVAGDRASTIVLPLPLDMLGQMLGSRAATAPPGDSRASTVARPSADRQTPDDSRPG